MDNIIDFPNRDAVLACPKCEGLAFYLTDEAHIECTECGHSPDDYIWSVKVSLERND